MAGNFEEVYVNNCRNNLMAFIINNSVSKIPIKQVDLLEVAEKKKDMLEHCLPVAQNALKKTYGIILKDVPDAKGGKKYICIAEDTAKSPHEYDEEQQSHLTLLFLILSYIFMNGCPVYENQIEEFLKGFKINLDETHDFFGANLRKLITDTFVKQLYLQKEKSDSEFDIEAKYLFSFGYRSTEEFDKKDVLKAVSKILGKPEKFFIAQYCEAHGIGLDAEG